MYISIHAPVKGATANTTSVFKAAIYISIHAPVKGATSFVYCHIKHCFISIHAPVKGATMNF